MALGVERVILEVLDVVGAAEQDAAFVMMPMAKFVADRETSTFRAAAAVDGDHGPRRGADNRRIATVERAIFDERPAAPRDRLQIDFFGVRNTEAHQNALGGGNASHSPPASSSSRSSLARSSISPSMSRSERPSPFLAASNILEARSGSWLRIFSKRALAASRSNLS